jgi:DNA-binding Xre family transcriptional regulator
MDTNIKEMRNILSTEINARLSERGISYRELALYSRTSRNAVYQYIRGDSLPNLWTLSLMADYLNCTVNDLLRYGDVYDNRNLDDRHAFNAFIHEDDFAVYVRDRILNRMSILRMNQTDLVEYGGFTKESVDRWLWICPHLPKLMQFLRICEALDCTPSDLLGY